MIIVILLFLFLIYILFFVKPRESFSFKLKNKINIVVFPETSFYLLKKIKEVCNTKYKDQCKKITIIKDDILNVNLNKKEKYIVLYNSKNTSVKDYLKLKKKWIDKKNASIMILDNSNLSSNTKNNISKLSKFLDFDITFSSNDLKMLSFFI